MTNLKSQRARKILDVVFQAFCILVGIALMAPVLYCLIISFMQESEIVSTELNLWPETFYLGNYIAVITQGRYQSVRAGVVRGGQRRRHGACHGHRGQ